MLNEAIKDIEEAEKALPCDTKENLRHVEFSQLSKWLKELRELRSSRNSWMKELDFIIHDLKKAVDEFTVSNDPEEIILPADIALVTSYENLNKMLDSMKNI